MDFPLELLRATRIRIFANRRTQGHLMAIRSPDYQLATHLAEGHIEDALRQGARYAKIRTYNKRAGRYFFAVRVIWGA